MSWNWGQYAFLPAFAAPGPGKPQSFHIFTDSCFGLPSWKILTNNTTATVDLESPFLILIQFQIRIEDCLSRKISSMNPVLKWLQNLQYSKGFIHKYTLKKRKRKKFSSFQFFSADGVSLLWFYSVVPALCCWEKVMTDIHLLHQARRPNICFLLNSHECESDKLSA